VGDSPRHTGAGETGAASKLPGMSPVRAEEPASAGLEQPAQAREEILLSEQLGRVRTMEDVEALASEEPVMEDVEALASEQRAEGREPPAAARAKKRARQREEGRAGDRRAKKPPAKKQLISLEAMLGGTAPEAPWPSLPVLVEEEVSGAGTGLPLSRLRAGG